MTRNWFGVLLALATLPWGCISRQDQEALDDLKARKQAREEILREPNRWVRIVDIETFNKGIVNDYTQTTALEFRNTTEFDVYDLKGRITYIHQDGSEMATVPFKALGEVPAGESVKLKVESNEIAGAARDFHARIISIRVRN